MSIQIEYAELRVRVRGVGSVHDLSWMEPCGKPMPLADLLRHLGELGVDQVVAVSSKFNTSRYGGDLNLEGAVQFKFAIILARTEKSDGNEYK